VDVSLVTLDRYPSWLLPAGAVLALSRLLPLPVHGHIAGIPSICPFQNLTGMPCPGCGLTRSFVCFAHGHFAEAFRYHALGPALFVALLGQTTITLLFPRFNWPAVVQRYAMPCALVALGLFGGWRMAGYYPWPS